MQFRLWPKFRTEKRSSLSAPPDWLVNTLSNIFGIQTKSGDKVDGAVSMVMALGGYMAGAAESKQDFWFVQL